MKTISLIKNEEKYETCNCKFDLLQDTELSVEQIYRVFGYTVNLAGARENFNTISAFRCQSILDFSRRTSRSIFSLTSGLTCALLLN